MVSGEHRIPIVTASDENYAPCLNVMLTSVLEHCKEASRVTFYVIDDGLTLDSKRILIESVKK